MNERPPHAILIENAIMFVVKGALDYGRRHVIINGYTLYSARWYGRELTLTEEEVDAIMAESVV